MKQLKLLISFLFLVVFISSCSKQESENKQELNQKIDTLNSKANHYLNIDLDSALYFAEKAVIKAQTTNYPKGEMDGLFQKGRIYYDQARRTLAMDAGKQSLVIAVSLFLINCSNPPQTTGPKLDGDDPKEILEMEPEWYISLEPQEGYTVGKGEGTSPSKVGARKIAIDNLLADLGQKTKAISEVRTESFFGQTGGDYDSSVRQQFEQIQSSVANASLDNYEEIRSATRPEDSVNKEGRKVTIYRTYITGRISKFTADQRLLEKIQMEEELLTAVKATEAYEKLQKDLEKYREKFNMK